MSPQEESGKKSEHQEMLLRLEWELEERQRYSTAGWSMGGVGSVPVRVGGLWSCSVVMGTLVLCARLQAQKESLVKSIDALKEDIQKRQEKLDSLQPSLSSLLKVTSCNLDR